MVQTLIDHTNDVKMFKTQVEPPWIHRTKSRRRVFSKQSFEHYEVISIVDKSIEHGILLSNNICSFRRPFLLTFPGKSYAQERENKWINLSFLETAHLPLPEVIINTYFSFREKCWVRGGVGGEFPLKPKLIQTNFHGLCSY